MPTKIIVCFDYLLFIFCFRQVHIGAPEKQPRWWQPKGIRKKPTSSSVGAKKLLKRALSVQKPEPAAANVKKSAPDNVAQLKRAPTVPKQPVPAVLQSSAADKDSSIRKATCTICKHRKGFRLFESLKSHLFMFHKIFEVKRKIYTKDGVTGEIREITFEKIRVGSDVEVSTVLRVVSTEEVYGKKGAAEESPASDEENVAVSAAKSTRSAAVKLCFQANLLEYCGSVFVEVPLILSCFYHGLWTRR